MSGAAKVHKADPNKLGVRYLKSSSVQQIGLSPPGALSQLDEDDPNPTSPERAELLPAIHSCPVPAVMLARPPGRTEPRADATLKINPEK